MLFFIIVVILFILYMVGVRESPRTAPAQAKQTQTPKKFRAPAKFEYNLQLALRLLACEHKGECCSCVITASNGTVRMNVNGIQDLYSVTAKFAPGAHQLFFRHPSYSSGSVSLVFNEPDCYIFNCSREGMQYDLDQHAPNAYISSWHESKGSKQVYIAFKRYPSEQETTRWNEFEKFYQIFCH